jgi:hypothetical protein
VNVASRKKVVLLGMITKMPVAGVLWQTLHYLVGFRRLGWDAYYVEAHARVPSWFMEHEADDGSERASSFLDDLLRRFDLGDRWAYHALHSDGRCFGLSEGQLRQLYDSADLLINLHGGTAPRPEHVATGRLVYLETDPVGPQIELYNGLTETVDFLAQHCAYFTFGENYGRPGCGLPVSDRFAYRPTRQPVVLDFWPAGGDGDATLRPFTTIGNWKQEWRAIQFRGEIYHWSKHREFQKFLDLPRRTGQALELALASFEESDRRLLEDHGWIVRRSLDFSADPDAYRQYIARSRGEFTVAKDQNVRLRSGWFSDRSATYLASGRPVVTQETGFSETLPTGQGLFAFSTLEEAIERIDRINADYALHSRAARAVAREYFDSDVVLSRLLADMGY